MDNVSPVGPAPTIATAKCSGGEVRGASALLSTAFSPFAGDVDKNEAAAAGPLASGSRQDARRTNAWRHKAPWQREAVAYALMPAKLLHAQRSPKTDAVI